MVHINGVPHDILSAVAAAATTPVPNIIPIVQIMSPSSAVIVPPPATPTEAAATPLSCYDTPNWTDAYGQNCAYYAYNGGYRCALLGTYESSSSTGGANAMGVAVDNCCACGGGSSSSSSSSSSVTTTGTYPVTTTTIDDDEGGDGDNNAVVVVVVGTCGKGKRGNGICAANGKCCSKVRE